MHEQTNKSSSSGPVLSKVSSQWRTIHSMQEILDLFEDVKDLIKRAVKTIEIQGSLCVSAKPSWIADP